MTTTDALVLARGALADIAHSPDMTLCDCAQEGRAHLQRDGRRRRSSVRGHSHRSAATAVGRLEAVL
jgi:hypothetical protein